LFLVWIDLSYDWIKAEEMSDYLFAEPSFFEGVARNMDLFGSMNNYNTSKSEQEADNKAFQVDVSSLQKDMDKAVSIVFN
jgi:hypothetical protein